MTSSSKADTMLMIADSICAGERMNARNSLNENVGAKYSRFVYISNAESATIAVKSKFR